MQIMAIAIIPVAVSVHTIVSFDFSMAPVPMWHSTMFGPYFVAGAIFSGIAGLIIAMAALRKFLHLEEYLHPVHFQNLGKLLLMMSLLWGYFVFAERLTVWYGNEIGRDRRAARDAEGLVRAALLDDGRRQLRHPGVDPLDQEAADDHRLRHRVVRRLRRHVARALPDRRAVARATSTCRTAWGTYRPRPVEIMITISTFAAMMLLYTLFSKFVPIISIWELKVGEQDAARDRCTNAPSTCSGRRVHERRLRVCIRRPDAAQRAVNGLRAAGVAAQRRSSSSSSGEPFEEQRVRSPRQRDLAVVYRAPAAASSASLFATWLTRMTELAWPLQTGNMPIVAWWPNLIVIFEMTMLGAILATVLTLFVTAKLPATAAGALRSRSDQRQDPRRRRKPLGGHTAGARTGPDGRRRRRTQKELNMRRSMRAAVVVALFALTGSAVRAQAPAPLPTSEAAKFMGAWVITLESPQGPFAMTMTVTDDDGKAASELTSDIMPAQKVTDISKSGDDLVLKYQGDFQGQAFAAKITLTPADDKLGVNFDVMDGQFMMTGVGTKK